MNKVPKETGYYWILGQHGWIPALLEIDPVTEMGSVSTIGMAGSFKPSIVPVWGDRIIQSEPVQSNVYDPKWSPNSKQHFDVYG